MKSPTEYRLFACLFVCAISLPTLQPNLLAQEFTNHTYQLVSAALTWHQAKADAESRGGHLATITSQAEFDYILSLHLPFPQVESYWLGATDEAQEGVWQWVTGEPWDFSLWMSGEPNNLGGENYLNVSASAGHFWNDWGKPQDAIYYYVLEIEPSLCTPHKAKATAQVVNGFVVGAAITDPSCGYTNTPIVLIQGGGGTGATARAVVSDGKITAIQITDAGCCYTNLPRIVISSPPMAPSVEIQVSKIKVIQNVVLGWKYVLESSANNVDWTATGPAFTAETDPVETEFPVDAVGRFFRLRVVP